MRIRSVLAAAALTVAVTAGGAASAFAGDDRGHHFPFNGGHSCSPYFGEIEMETAEVRWGGARCDGDH
ncbi:hypothetical protein [Streptomyces sp. B93]|uniref:hypothetical protein n=1 Tax=Streptomyces sp. B93 TaxID=2824875 RepID=UPI001B387138|nr:hypothetical protein [Streptomyces sp. B93]MBQ1087965.1 hypothetical protein [Streptomyces sp. B93]